MKTVFEKLNFKNHARILVLNPPIEFLPLTNNLQKNSPICIDNKVQDFTYGFVLKLRANRTRDSEFCSKN